MTQDDIITHREGAIGRITLNRPRALNALTEDMCAAMLTQLRQWAVDPAVHAVVTDAVPGKAFCAGGDIRAVYDAGKRADGSVMSFFRTEYPLNAAIRRLPEAVYRPDRWICVRRRLRRSIHGSYRVASENAVFSMPETAIGLFPDIGATYFLNQLPGEIGKYLALTSVRISAADALYCGLATHFVPSRDHAQVLSRLAQGEKADLVLAAFGGKPSGVSSTRGSTATRSIARFLRRPSKMFSIDWRSRVIGETKRRLLCAAALRPA
jgi:enoyl-CoA hydratase